MGYRSIQTMLIYLELVPDPPRLCPRCSDRLPSRRIPPVLSLMDFDLLPRRVRTSLLHRINFHNF